MKKYIIYLSSSIVVEAASAEQAKDDALGIIDQIISEPNITSSDTEEILTGLRVDDLTAEYEDGDDDEQLPEAIAANGSIARIYDHDHAQGWCGWND